MYTRYAIEPPSDEARVILVSTGSRSGGGIAVALNGFVKCVRDQGLLHAQVSTHNDHLSGGCWSDALLAVRPVVREVRRLRSRGLRPVVYAHAGESLSMARKISLLSVARAAGARTMLQLHAPNVDQWLECGWSRRVLGRSLRSVDCVCVLTPYWRERLQRELDIDTSVIPDPLPPCDEARAREPLDRGKHTNHSLTLLTMARLVEGKGADVAIATMALLPPEYRLIIAGDGPMLPQLKHQARQLGVQDRVEFAGWVEGPEKAQLLERSDVFLLPTTYDSFCMGFIEAQAAGTPPVGVRYGAIPDVVRHGETGLLSPTRNPHEVAIEVRRLADPTVRRAMGLRGKSHVLERFSTERVGRLIRGALTD